MKTWLAIVFGILAGVAIYHSVLVLTNTRVVSIEEIERYQNRISTLEKDNRLLSDNLFGIRRTPGVESDGMSRPYDDTVDAREQVSIALKNAQENGRYLMITFGANWCVDCRTLYSVLESDELIEYTADRFDFINVDVGVFNRNLDVAADLGVTLSRGIPVAIFFDPVGEVIGTTNNGELEPARRFSSNQILRFMRDIAERSQIRAPDTVQTND